jgi:predicted transcriptional regulator
MGGIRDIAGELGLSPATVSKALNGYAGVRAETREKVFREAERQHYTVLPLSVRRERSIREEQALQSSDYQLESFKCSSLEQDASGRMIYNEKVSDQEPSDRKIYDIALRVTSELIRQGFRQISYETSFEAFAAGVEKACMSGNVIAKRNECRTGSALGILYARSASDDRDLVRTIENPAEKG